jgi:hypothetical protein
MAMRKHTAESVLRKLVIAWDADQDLEFDEAMALARGVLGFKLAEGAPRCCYCGGLADVLDGGACEYCREFEKAVP